MSNPDPVATGAQIERLARENHELRARLAAPDAHRKAWVDRMVESIPHLMFLIGPDDRYLDVSMGGGLEPFVSPDRLVGRTVDEVFAGEPITDELHGALARARASGRTELLDYALPLPDGVHYYQARITPLADGTVASLVLDVTDRIRDRAAHGERETLLRTIFETEPECVTVVSPDGRIVEINPVGLAMLEIDGVEAAGPLETFVVREDRPQFLEAYQRVIAGETVRLGYRMTGRRGADRWVETTAAPLRDADGVLRGILAVTRDVTGRRQAEDELRAGKERFRAIGDAMPLAMLITRFLDGLVLYANQPVAELFGVTREQMEGHTTSGFYAQPADRETILGRLRAEGTVRNFEVLGRNARGEEFWMTASFQLTVWNGEPAILAGIVDLTGRKRMEDELRASEELYRALFEANPFPMFAYDVETTRFLAANDTAVRHYGYTREEFLAMSVQDIRPPEDIPLFRQLLARAIERDRATTNVGRHQRRDGSIIQVEVTGSPVVFQGRAARMVTVHDITERRRLEEDLRHAQKLESVGRLAGGVAHDFNNLLTAILGYTQLVEARLAGEPELLADLEEIRQAGERARDLTSQLLAVARRQVSAPRVIDLNELASAMERLLRRVLGEHIELVTRCHEPVWPIRADPAQLEQVVMNLAINSRDAMPQGGRLSIRTENVSIGRDDRPPHPDLKPGDYTVLEIRDTGVGMSPEVLSHMFEPFFTTKPMGQGTGLGLATVYGIMKQGGGQVWVDSVPGSGTTFGLYFPRSLEPRAPADPEGEAPPPGGHETVLVVEDDPAVRALIVRTLEQAGYSVAVAVAGDEALRVAAGFPRPIDLLVTDVVMPRMNGRDLAVRMQQSRPAMRVMFVSGYASGASSPAGDDDSFLPKPFTASLLLRRVRDALDATPRAAS